MKAKRTFFIIALNILNIVAYEVIGQQISELKPDSIPTITKEELMQQKEADKEKKDEAKDIKNEIKPTIKKHKDSKTTSLKISKKSNKETKTNKSGKKELILKDDKPKEYKKLKT